MYISFFQFFLLLEPIELNKNEKIKKYVETLEVDQLKLDKKKFNLNSNIYI